MRCHEARSRLNESARIDRERDRELLQHLKQCPACARVAEAADELRQAFAEATVHDEADGLDWIEQKRRVEAAANPTRTNQPKEMPFMSRLKKQLKLRPRLTLGLAAAALVLIAGTVIPLKFDQTVGFEVAVAGVDRDLALNQEKLNEMLKRLGLEDVHIDIKGCEATCNLVVSDLNSENDAQMVKLAFEEIGKENVHVELIAVREGVSGSAVSHALSRIWVSEGQFEQVDEELCQIVIERLGNEFNGDGAVFMSLSEDHDGSEHEFTWVSDADGNVSVDDKVAIQLTVGDDLEGHTFKKAFCITTDGHGSLPGSVIGPGDLVDGRLTDEARAALEAEGYTVEEIPGDDGTMIFRLTRGDANNECVMELKIKVDEDESAAKKAELPEGYELSQNYPNPFNPSTQIAYSLPQAEHVTIEIFNINGRLIKTLVDKMMPAGDHTVEWNATNEIGDRVSSGVYLYRFSAGEISQSKKMTLVK